MTNKEELKKRFEKVVSEPEKNCYVVSWNRDNIFNFFWNEIEQIRKLDMERVERDIIELGNNREHRDLIREVLSIMKQDE